MILWSNLEYVTLRIIRRFLFNGEVLDRLGSFIPYWRVNQGRLDPEPIVTAYQQLARQAGVDLHDKRVVELGCGATNGTGYEWTARFRGHWTGVEPFAFFDQDLDATLFANVRMRQPSAARERTSRMRELAGLDSGSADIIVSNSVLEHVRDPLALFEQCQRVLTPEGMMLHQVDYRDHFFKYPFHFLTFSKALWDNLLDPGDLPRFRLDDHLMDLRSSGFACEVLKRDTDPEALAAILPFLAPEFSSRDRGMLSTTTAALACRKV